MFMIVRINKLKIFEIRIFNYCIQCTVFVMLIDRKWTPSTPLNSTLVVRIKKICLARPKKLLLPHFYTFICKDLVTMYTQWADVPTPPPHFYFKGSCDNLFPVRNINVNYRFDFLLRPMEWKVAIVNNKTRKKKINIHEILLIWR